MVFFPTCGETGCWSSNWHFRFSCIYIFVCLCVLFSPCYTQTHTMVVLHSFTPRSEPVKPLTHRRQQRQAGQETCWLVWWTTTQQLLFFPLTKTHTERSGQQMYTHTLSIQPRITKSRTGVPLKLQNTSKREEMKIYSGTKLPLEWKQKLENTWKPNPYTIFKIYNSGTD